ncbi:MAG: methylmalonyl-CoA mutase family protein [Planctomycetota bacterium]
MSRSELPPLSYPFAPRGLADWAPLAGDRAQRAREGREGLRVRALYTTAEPLGAPPRSAGPGWTILQELRAASASLAATRAREALSDGAEGLLLRVGIGGVQVRDLETVEPLVAALGSAPLFVRAGTRAREVAALLLARRSPAELRGSLGLDPLGTLAACGRLPQGLETAYAHGAELARACAQAEVRVLDVESAPYHDAGASAALELACVLGALVDGFRGMEPALDLLRPAVTVSLGPDLLGGVAKLRALRLLYAQVAEPCGLDPADLHLTAVSALRSLSRRDPWGNMLRGTLAAWVGAVGGADAIAVAPFDRRYPDSDALARRVARTTQLVLREEAHLGQVQDPFAGAYAVEALTRDLAQAAWTAFQELEREGGLARALATGSVQRRIAEHAEGVAAKVRARRVELTGVSAFPLAGEAPLVRAAPIPTDPGDEPPPAEWGELLAAAANGRRLGEPRGDATEVEWLPARPLAAPFEALWERAGEAPPTVFLASFGPLAGHTGRSTWVQNLLAAGGFVAEVPDGYADVGEAAAACRAAEVRLAVVSAPDALWDGLLQAGLPHELRAAGCTRVLWAGVRAEDEARFRAAGVDGFVGLGRDALADLNLLWEGLS